MVHLSKRGEYEQELLGKVGDSNSRRKILLDKPGKFLCYGSPYDVFMTDEPLPSHRTWEWVNGEWVERTWKYILVDNNGDEVHRKD